MHQQPNMETGFQGCPIYEEITHPMTISAMASPRSITVLQHNTSLQEASCKHQQPVTDNSEHPHENFVCTRDDN